jgi:HJR/Mrr/RecB family endonuclease
METFLELITTIGRFLVGLWPLMFITVLVGVFKHKKGFGAMLRTSIKALVVSWGFFAVLNLVFYFLKMDTFQLLPESINMKLFFSVGLLLLPFEVAILIEERHKKVNADTLEEMQALSPSQFEKLVAETYRDQGHKVEIVGATGDHGIDLVVHTRKGETWLVQCKKYRGKVGEPVIRDFYGALRAANADAGAVITTGTITAQARLWAEGKPLFLYDGEEFLQVIQTTHIRKSLPVEAKKKVVVNPVVAAPVLQTAFAVASPSAMPMAASYPMNSTTIESIAVPVVESVEPDTYPPQDKRPFMNLDDTPVCPACGIPMLLQTEKRMFFKPRQHYICQNAPSCSETFEVD